MKKNTIFYSFALALALFSCSKEKSPAPEQDAPMRFAVTVEGTTKASMTSADLTQFYLKVTGPSDAFSYFESIVKDATGKWAGTKPLFWKNEASSITYAAASYGALGADYFNIPVTSILFTNGATMGLLTDQSTQARLNAADLLTMASTDLTFAASDKGIVPITLKHGLAKVNFVVSIDNAGELTAEGIKDVVVSGVYNAFSFKPLTGEVTAPIGASKGAVVPFLSSIEAGVVTLEAVLVPETLAAGALSLYITVNGKDFQWTNSEALELAQGGEYTVPVSIDYNTVPSGPVTPDPGPTPVSAVFTVSAGKTVQFSPGNLQYTKSTGTWSFMANQYSTVETTSQNVGDDYASQDVVSLFGLGTKDNPNNTSKTSSDYSWNEWGENTSLVSALGSGWRTLTGGSGGEWEWVLGPSSSPNPGTNCRTSSTIGSTENARYVKATVHSTKGLIIFPDEITWDPTTMGDAPTTCNSAGDVFTYSPTDANWAALEAAGCVFLPAAGYRNGTSVNLVGSYGFYWSSTPYGTNSAYYLFFLSGSVSPANLDSRYLGFSVRLVRDAN